MRYISVQSRWAVWKDPFIAAFKRIKYLWTNSTKEVKDIRNYTRLLKEIKEDQNKCKDIHPTFVDWKAILVKGCSCLVAQSCLTPCYPMDCSPQGSSVHGILQARYWSGLPCPSPGDLANPRGLPFPPPADLLNPEFEPESSALAGRFFTTSTTWEALEREQYLPKTVYRFTGIPIKIPTSFFFFFFCRNGKINPKIHM